MTLNATRLAVPARIAWRVGRSRVMKGPGVLLDINPAGGMMMTRCRVTEGETVWVGLKELPGEWVRGSVIGVGSVRGMTLCQVAFREECAPGLLEMARSDVRCAATDAPDRLPWESDDDDPAWYSRAVSLPACC